MRERFRPVTSSVRTFVSRRQIRPRMGGTITGVAMACLLVLVAAFLWGTDFGVKPIEASASASPKPKPLSAVSVSKVLVDGREFGNKDHIFGVDAAKETGEVVKPVQVFVTDTFGKAVSGVKFTVNGKEGTTGSDGSATVPTSFMTKEQISGPSALEIKAGDKSWKEDVWVFRYLDNPVSTPALTRSDAMLALNKPEVQSAFKAVGLRAEDVIDVVQDKSTGEYMIGWSGGNIVTGGFIPKDQPVWRYIFRSGTPSSAATSNGPKPGSLVVNPVCVNITTPVPTRTPAPSTRVVVTPSPTPVVTPSPTPAPTATPIVTPSPTPVPSVSPVAVNLIVGPFSHTDRTNVQTTTITASVNGGYGSGTYSYLWDGSSNSRPVSGQGTNTVVAEVTGCYTFTVSVLVVSTDPAGSGNSVTGNQTWSGKPGNCPDTVLTVRVSQGSWSAYNSATNSYSTTLTATASGGARPIRWQDGSSGDSFSTTIQVAAGQSASGTVTATDNFGTVVTQSWTVTAPLAPPTPSTATTPASPRVNITATKAATATGCTYTLSATTESGSFSYSWSNGSTSSTTQVTLTFGQSGSATVTVRDTSASRPAGTANWQDVCGSSGY